MPSPLLPSPAISHLEADYRLPEAFKSFQMLDVVGTTLSLKEGSLYIQVRTINGFSIAYLIYQLHQPLSIPCVSEEASGILHYVLQGTLPIPEEGIQTTSHLWLEQQYGLSYCSERTILSFLFPSGEYHFFQIAFSFHLLSLLMQKKKLLAGTPSLIATLPVFTSPIPITKTTRKNIAQALSILYEAPHDVLKLHKVLLQSIASHLRVYQENERNYYWNKKKELQFVELENYILDHLAVENGPKLALSILLKKTKTNAYQFKKLFRQQYGVSLATFIKQKRMAKAKQLITEIALPAGDIYQLVGYEDFSSFSRAFTNFFGHSPSQYRNKQ